MGHDVLEWNQYPQQIFSRTTENISVRNYKICSPNALNKPEFMTSPHSHTVSHTSEPFM